LLLDAARWPVRRLPRTPRVHKMPLDFVEHGVQSVPLLLLRPFGGRLGACPKAHVSVNGMHRETE
jgi:hypothetical protein